MPDQTPAETLRIAAEILRHTAQRAIHKQGPRWMLGTTVADKAAVVVDHPDDPTVLIQSFAERLEAVNAYLVRVHPGVGLTLADWLDDEARAHEAAEQAAANVFHDDPGNRAAWIAAQTNDAALAVARALLGEVTR